MLADHFDEHVPGMVVHTFGDSGAVSGATFFRQVFPSSFDFHSLTLINQEYPKIGRTLCIEKGIVNNYRKL